MPACGACGRWGSIVDVSRDLEVRCYPSTDLDFFQNTLEILASQRVRINDSRRLLDLVHEKLREKYPRAQVHERTELARPDEHEPDVWYVYRDGHAA